VGIGNWEGHHSVPLVPSGLTCVVVHRTCTGRGQGELTRWSSSRLCGWGQARERMISSGGWCASGWDSALLLPHEADLAGIGHGYGSKAAGREHEEGKKEEDRMILSSSMCCTLWVRFTIPTVKVEGRPRVLSTRTASRAPAGGRVPVLVVEVAIRHSHNGRRTQYAQLSVATVYAV
jgi:hypothetical protein